MSAASTWPGVVRRGVIGPITYPRRCAAPSAQIDTARQRRRSRAPRFRSATNHSGSIQLSTVMTRLVASVDVADSGQAQAGRGPDMAATRIGTSLTCFRDDPSGFVPGFLAASLRAESFQRQLTRTWHSPRVIRFTSLAQREPKLKWLDLGKQQAFVCHGRAHQRSASRHTTLRQRQQRASWLPRIPGSRGEL